jgi:hypothetical protein
VSRRDLTVVLPYYENPGMLQEHERSWATFPAKVRDHLQAIVVDDCSPTRPAVLSPVTSLASVRLFRILEKRRWNWLACRNLGVSQAATDWVLLTDIDHLLPVETVEYLQGTKLDPMKVYRLSRVDAPRPLPYALSDCASYKIHPNTWLMTRAMFDRIGGYDERLSGCYGTDGEFRDRVNIHARAVVILTQVHIRYPREIIADASTVGFTRKNDEQNDKDLIARRIERDKISGWRPLRLSFPWERVA